MAPKSAITSRKIDEKQASADILNIVKGSPSKELFIDMLIRDISLIDAISDLVDNCVDGAIKLRGKGKYTHLRVDISINDKQFIIKDNCGGIDKTTAQEYAFRFGRPSKANQINFSVGQFGIGMKRALFKIGKYFEINSVSTEGSFTIKIDVDKWSKIEDKWDFAFEKRIAKKYPLSKCGTEIIVTSLKEDVVERFKQNNFLTDLRNKLELQHLINLSKGIEININTHPLKSSPLNLYDGDRFKTAYWEKKFNIYGNTNVEIYAGIGTEEIERGGWYIFCNNRLIQGPEQTIISGWGAKTPVKIPEYHSQFRRFRGITFFESKKPSYLPWNTSKTGVDTDSRLFQSVREEMIYLMRPIIDFLNDVHEESKEFHNNKIAEKFLENEIQSSNLKDYLNVKTSHKFAALPKKRKAKKTNDIKILYHRNKNKVEELKKLFKVSSPKQVGEKTFDYTYDRECKD
jgi:hypothetical protein